MKVITALLATLALVPMLFIGVTASEYDPWLDSNDDGKIDIFDVVKVAGAYGTSGISINKTQLLLELQEKVNTLNASLAEVNAKVTELEAELVVLNATKLGVPDYDSGWTIINTGQQLILMHNLNTTEVLVYVIGYRAGRDIHQEGYGLLEQGDLLKGLYWTNLTDTSIICHRQLYDPFWEQVRVLIWKIPQP